jgi:hypothetical protein
MVLLSLYDYFVSMITIFYVFLERVLNLGSNAHEYFLYLELTIASTMSFGLFYFLFRGSTENHYLHGQYSL